MIVVGYESEEAGVADVAMNFKENKSTVQGKKQRGRPGHPP